MVMFFYVEILFGIKGFNDFVWIIFFIFLFLLLVRDNSGGFSSLKWIVNNSEKISGVYRNSVRRSKKNGWDSSGKREINRELNRRKLGLRKRCRRWKNVIKSEKRFNNVVIRKNDWDGNWRNRSRNRNDFWWKSNVMWSLSEILNGGSN